MNKKTHVVFIVTRKRMVDNQIIHDIRKRYDNDVKIKLIHSLKVFNSSGLSEFIKQNKDIGIVYVISSETPKLIIETIKQKDLSFGVISRNKITLFIGQKNILTNKNSQS